MKNLLRQSLSLVLFSIFIICGSNISFAQRYWNTAAKFDGTPDSYIAVEPFGPLKDLSGSFTVECWFNCSTVGERTLFGKNGFRLMLDPINSYMVRGRMQTNVNTKLYTSIAHPMKINTWYHLACTYDSSNGIMSFYINGELDTSTTRLNSGPLPGTDSLYIGGNFGYFKGMLDDIRIWSIALSPGQILQHYRYSFIGPINNTYNRNFLIYPYLLLSCNFDFTYTGPFNGISCYDGFNHYDPHNVTPVDLGSHPSQTIYINSALALGLSNINYGAIASDPSNDLSGPMTIEAWIYPQNVSSSPEYIISKASTGGTGYFLFYSLYNNQPVLWFGSNSGGSGSNGTAPLNQWTYVAATISSNNIGKLYINGNLDFSVNQNFPVSNSDSLYIGNIPSGTAANNFSGFIDAVKISNYEKTQSEIQNDMYKITDYENAPAPPKYTASYNFDYNGYSATNTGGYCFLKGGAYYTTVYIDSSPLSPVSPMMGNNYPGFPDKFTIDRSVLRIPQFNSAGYMQNDSLNITKTGNVSDVKLFVALNHASLSDLQISLLDPSGDSVLVWNNDYGISSCDNLTTVFDDESPDTIKDGKYVDFSPSIKPANSLDQAFAGKKAGGKWVLKITDIYNGNTGFLYGWGLEVNTVTGVKDFKSSSLVFQLSQNYPNPFNPSTKIKYSIPSAHSPLPGGASGGLVTLKVYDLLGREVATLVDEKQQPGNYEVTFDGSKLSSGIYFYRLQADSHIQTKKMILLK